MTRSAEPTVLWRGAEDPGAPLVVLLHGRGSDERDIIGAPLRNAGVYPRPVQEQLPVWVAVGGTPASVVRAGRHGLPLYLAILGAPARFAPLADLYRTTAAQHGLEPGVG